MQDNNPVVNDTIVNFDTQLDTMKGSQLELMEILIGEQDSSENAVLTCETFLKMFRGYSRGGEYDLSVLIADEDLKKDRIIFRLSEAEYYKQLNAALGWEITADEQKLTAKEKIIHSDSAIIVIFEEYSYNQTDGMNQIGCRTRTYTFTLKKFENIWKIIDITTDDPWENIDSFTYEAIDVEKRVNEIKEESEAALE